MIHRGRNRYRTHLGIPSNHGVDLFLQQGTKQEIQEESDGMILRWRDQSGNDNHAFQEDTETQAKQTTDGGADFEEGDGDHYDLDSQIAVSSQHSFAVWFVLKTEDLTGNRTLLGLNNTQHFLELKGGGDSIRVKTSTTTTQISPGDGTQDDFVPGEKMVITLLREGGATGNYRVYKNGFILSQDSQSAHDGDAEFVTVGVRNADRYYDGIMYDVVFLDNGSTTTIPDYKMNQINAYLCSKHGLFKTS